MWAAGRNDFGQLGAGAAMSSYVFVPVMSGHTLAMFAGEWHSMVVKRDGSVWAAGANLFGQLGDGSTLSKKTFVKVISRDGATDAQGVEFIFIFVFVQFYGDISSIRRTCVARTHSTVTQCTRSKPIVCGVLLHNLLTPCFACLPVCHVSTLS